MNPEHYDKLDQEEHDITDSEALLEKESSPGSASLSQQWKLPLLLSLTIVLLLGGFAGVGRLIVGRECRLEGFAPQAAFFPKCVQSFCGFMSSLTRHSPAGNNPFLERRSVQRQRYSRGSSMGRIGTK